MSKLCGIYVVTHLETGMRYVGQSRDIARRWKSHTYTSKESWLSRAIHKYGVQAFSFQVLELCEIDALDRREIAWIAELDTIKPNGFNLDSGGNQQKVRSESTKEKIRQKAIAYARENGRSLSTRKTGGVEIYHDFAHVDGRRVTCTQWELKTYHVADYAERGTKFDASTLVAGRCNILRGWMLASRVDEVRAAQPHLFPMSYEHTDGRTVVATELEMQRLHGADTNITALRKGRQKTCCGWRLNNEGVTQ